MMAMYWFLIGNYGQYFFRIDQRSSHFSSNMDQKAASISSESGHFLLPFAASLVCLFSALAV